MAYIVLCCPIKQAWASIKAYQTYHRIPGLPDGAVTGQYSCYCHTAVLLLKVCSPGWHPWQVPGSGPHPLHIQSSCPTGTPPSHTGPHSGAPAVPRSCQGHPHPPPAEQMDSAHCCLGACATADQPGVTTEWPQYQACRVAQSANERQRTARTTMF